MQTKGVASVRSPVRNLQSFAPSVSHEAFVDAVISSFKDEYGVNEEVWYSNQSLQRSHTNLTRLPQPQYIDECESTTSIEYIAHGMNELPVCHHTSLSTCSCSLNDNHRGGIGHLVKLQNLRIPSHARTIGGLL